MHRRLIPWAALLAAVTLLYGLNIFFFPRDLWVQDEARYGEVVREMATFGHYFVPTIEGHFYPDKPPLYFWLMLLQSKVTGMGMLTFRLVTLWSLLGFAAAFFALARSSLGVSRGLWAVLIALTSELFLITGNIVRMDILLAMLVTLSLHFLLRGFREERARLGLVGYGVAIVATMVKGPLGFAFPVLGAAAYAFAWGRLRGLRRLRLPQGIGLALALGLGWTAYLYATGQGAYVQEVLVKQLWGRSVGSWSHSEPPYFYALVLLPLFMPWLPYLRLGLARAPEDARRVAVCWFVPGFLLISAISGKLFVYLVPLVPPLAILVAAALPPPWERSEQRPQRFAAFLAGAFLAAAGAAGLYALGRFLPQEWRLFPVPLSLIGLGAVVAVLGVKGRERAATASLLVAACVTSWVCLGWGATRINDYFSARPLGVQLRRYVDLGYQAAAVDIAPGTLGFYAGTTLRQLSNGDLGRALDAPGRLVVVVRNKKRAAIPAQTWARLAPVAEFPKLEVAGYALYVERAPSPAPLPYQRAPLAAPQAPAAAPAVPSPATSPSATYPPAAALSAPRPVAPAAPHYLPVVRPMNPPPPPPWPPARSVVPQRRG